MELLQPKVRCKLGLNFTLVASVAKELTCWGAGGATLELEEIIP